MTRRSKPRAYLLLSRVSNLPTVWTNVLASLVVSGAPLASWVPLAASASLFYTGGMFLNDAFDADSDAAHRVDRPIPAGEVSRTEVFVAGSILLAVGLGLLLLAPHPVPALIWGTALAAAIVVYDFKHKGYAFGPVVMGLCRALVYGVAAAGALGAVPVPAAEAGVVMWVYVISLTWVATTAGLGYAVPWLLAGICLVDAVMIGLSGAPELAALAAAGFALTLALQRVVPGT
jgi:4-hydroxybenzoate polyprenyltransferase